LTWTLTFSIVLSSVIEYLPLYFGRETWYWGAAWVLPLLVFLSSMPRPTHHRIEEILGYVKIVCLCGIILSTIVLTVFPTTSQEVANAFNLNNIPTGVPRPSFFSSVGRDTNSDAGGTRLPIWIWMLFIVFGWIGSEHYPVDKLEKIDLARHKSPLQEAKSAYLQCLLGYILACFSTSLNVAYQDSRIMDSVSNLAWLMDRSPFTLAIQGRLRVWPSLLNGFAILSAISAANTALYISSRILYRLALVESKWPRWGWIHAFKIRLRKPTNSGALLCAMMTTLLFGGLGCQLLRTSTVQVVALSMACHLLLKT
jgi:amino acid permease